MNRRIHGLFLSIPLFVLLTFGTSLSFSGSLLPEFNIYPSGYGGGGRFTSVAVHPQNPDIVLAGSDVAGTFKSTDSGDSFFLTGQDLGGFSVADIAFHPADPALVFLLTDDGLYLSRTTGERWLKISDRIFYKSRIFGSRLILFSRYSAWVATDRSGLFQVPLLPPDPVPVKVGNLDGKKINSLFIHRNRLIAATNRGVFRFMGNRWSPLGKGLTASEIMDIGGDPYNHLYAVEKNKGLYAFDAAKKSWVHRKLPRLMKIRDNPKGFKSLFVDPKNPLKIMLGTHPETWPHVIFSSFDGGKTWQDRQNFQIAKDGPDHWAIKKSLSGIEEIVFAKSSPSLGFIADWWNIWKTSDSGRTWHQLHKGLQNTVVNDIKTAPGNSSVIFASAWDNGLMVSEDNGKTWKRRMKGIPPGHAWEVEFSKQNPSRVYLLVTPWFKKDKYYVYRSSDMGHNWDFIGFPVPSTPLAREGFVSGMATNIEVDPLDDDILYVGTNGHGIFVTKNGGKTWEQSNTGLTTPYIQGPDALKIHPKDSRILFASTQKGGVFKSTDRGKKWEKLMSGDHFTFGLAINPADPSFIIAAGANKSLYLSKDTGKTWKEILLPGTRKDYLFSNSVSFHPDDPDIILIGTGAYDMKPGDGLFISRDGGMTFSGKELDLPRVNINDILINPKRPLSAWIGFSGIGIFKLEEKASL